MGAPRKATRTAQRLGSSRYLYYRKNPPPPIDLNQTTADAAAPPQFLTHIKWLAGRTSTMNHVTNRSQRE
jgi:hypothetical protein